MSRLKSTVARPSLPMKTWRTLVWGRRGGGPLGGGRAEKALTLPPDPAGEKEDDQDEEDDGEAAQDERLPGDPALLFLGHGVLLGHPEIGGEPAGERRR